MSTIIHTHELPSGTVQFTDNGAVFINGAQVVVPQDGINVVKMLKAALDAAPWQAIERVVPAPVEEQYREARESADPDAAAVLEAPKRNRQCGAIHPNPAAQDAMGPCYRERGHEGAHRSWLSGPELDDHEWHDHPVNVAPSPHFDGIVTDAKAEAEAHSFAIGEEAPEPRAELSEVFDALERAVAVLRQATRRD